MSVPASPLCPCCASHGVLHIGKLPVSHWFAGKQLTMPLTGGALYRCRDCNLKFRYPVHETAAYRALYNNAATSTWPADTKRPDWDLITQYVFEQLPQGGQVLDFGCYSGGLLARLGSRYRRCGVEVNRAAADIASERIHGPIWSSLQDIPQNLRFDVVTVADVVEHMADPYKLLESLIPFLSDRGVLIITTGDAENSLWNRFGANWWYCFYPEHLAFISKPWLNYFSRSAGMKIVRCETFRYRQHNHVRRLLDAIFIHWYGWFPGTFVQVGGRLKRAMGCPGVTSVAGAGVSRDHLFVVLSRSCQP